MRIRFSPAYEAIAAAAREGRLRMQVERDSASGPLAHEIWFTVPRNFHAHPDCVAAAFATLCGRDYDEIEFGFAVSDHCRTRLAEHCGARIIAAGVAARRAPGSAIGLNFSGGFDSLAAYLLTPGGVSLVASDFGPDFARERAYFETHHPAVVSSTNLRSEGFARADWRFMAAAAILHADYLGLGTIAFGSILEATPWNFVPARAPAPPPRDPLFDAAGLEEASPIRGLTEFGTAMILDRLGPAEIEPSLASLADPGTEKLFRKRLLIDTVRHRAGGAAPDFDAYSYPRRKTPFGTSFAVDFLALQFAQLYGTETVERWIEGIGAEELGWLKSTELRFYYRYNPNFLAAIPAALRETVLAGYARCGLLPYDEYDWRAFAEVRAFLARVHDIPQ